MNYQKVSIKKLKQDKNQPRQYFDDDQVAGLAVSIKNEGIINPIEVDENFVIVTGERRYRAAKLAGLTEVPIKILPKMTYKDRFIRQVQENIHQNTMSTWDTAKAFRKVIDLLLKENPNLQPAKKGTNNLHGNFEVGVKELHELFGISKRYIEELLSLIGETKQMKKMLDEAPNLHSAKIILLQRPGIPDQYKKDIRQLVLDQKGMFRDSLYHVIMAVRRGDKYGEHDKIRELLSQNYEGLTAKQCLKKIEEIIPTEENRIKGAADATDVVSKRVIEMVDLLEKYPFEGFDPYHKQLVGRDLSALGFFLQGYLKEMDMSDIKKKKPKLLK